MHFLADQNKDVLKGGASGCVYPKTANLEDFVMTRARKDGACVPPLFPSLLVKPYEAMCGSTGHDDGYPVLRLYKGLPILQQDIPEE